MMFSSVTIPRRCQTLWLTIASSRIRSRPPDGSRHEGKKACIELWTQIATNPGIRFEPEGIIARGNRGEIRWRPIWGPDHASSVRGVNLMRTFATGGSSRPKATSRARDSSQFKQSLVLSAAQSADRARSCVTPS
ncbi:hypothetical protein [Bradyrhizobium sp.]|jgi:hypothetical protein|uniref:hypothetical protein n=1 Tax=Bradyrhizobium sp. TaxID=376 RepID=UPI003BAED907